MKHLFLAASAVLLLGTGILTAAEPAQKKTEPKKTVQKCACTGEAVCKCDKAKTVSYTHLTLPTILRV